jgi:hypothetical protein
LDDSGLLNRLNIYSSLGYRSLLFFCH